MVGTPKSRAGMRTAAIPPHIVDSLALHLNDHVAPAKDSLLFAARDGCSHCSHRSFTMPGERLARRPGAMTYESTIYVTPAQPWRP